MEKQDSNIYAELKRKIIDMEYQPGQVLNEKQLAEEFHVSRTPVREALLKLSGDKLVDIVPRMGTYISKIDIMNIKYVYETKKNLEALAAELAAQRATQVEIDELFKIIERIKAYDVVKDYKKCIEDDQQFHRITLEAAKNPVLVEYLENLSMQTTRFLQYIKYVVTRKEWYVESLSAIANAINNRNSKQASLEAEKHTDAFLQELSQIFFK